MPSATTPVNDAASLGQRAIGRRLLPLAAGAIALLTLTPAGDGSSAALPSLWCLRCGDFGAVDVVLNVMLFMPLGLALGLMGVPARRIVLAALLTSICVEAVQLAVIAGRDASLSDVLTNTTGGALGALIALQWRRLVLPAPPDARTFLALFLLAWTATRIGTAWLLRPSFPETVWYGQLAPRDVYPADFRGELIHADIGGVAVRTGQMPELRNALRVPSFGVRALIGSAERALRLASVISVLDEHRTEVLLLGQEGTAARFRVRLRSADARFRTPSVILDSALLTDAHGPTELTGFWSPGRLSLASTAAGRSRGAAVGLGPGLGWALLLPFDTGLTPVIAEAGTAALVATAVLFVGYFAGMSIPGRTVAAISLALALAIAGLWFPAIVFPEATVSASEALTAALGAIAGVLSAKSVCRLRQAT